MVNSMYNFADVEAKLASPLTINGLVKNVLRANDGVCYAEIETFLMPPGKTGSRSFDQANAVLCLLVHDKELESSIATFMAATPTLNQRLLWDILQRVLRQAGFKMQHGRLTGLLDHKPAKKDDNGDEAGQPDID